MRPDSTELFGVQLEEATLHQCHAICDLINMTYRGERGWTRETHLLDGNRTDYADIKSAFSQPDGYFLVIQTAQLLVACIYIKKAEGGIYIGFFAVHPDFQGKGLGKEILRRAEISALIKFGAHKFTMYVVSQRTELIAFYERRGYRRIGQIEAYPTHLGIGIPKIQGLSIEYLEKSVNNELKYADFRGTRSLIK